MVAKCVPSMVLGFLNEGLPYQGATHKQRRSRESVARPIPSGICLAGDGFPGVTVVGQEARARAAGRAHGSEE